jgi:hypothetical protein
MLWVFSHLEWCWLLFAYIGFIMLSYISSITISSKIFINFAKSSFCLYWDIFIFILCYAYKLYYIYLLVYVEQSLYPWNETKLMMVHYLCNTNFIHFVCFYFIENFASVYEGNWSINFFYSFHIWVWYQNNKFFMEWIW